MKQLSVFRIAASLSIIAICASAIKVSPAVFTARNVPIGERTPLGLELKVYNDSEDPMTYGIEVVQPGENETLLEGYSPIFEREFFIVDGEAEFEVPPKSVESRMMFVDIPENEEYYNQMWSVSVVVTSGKGMFKTAVATKYYIETPSRRLESSPLGEIAIMPSAVELSKDTNEASFKLFNNGNETKIFTIAPFVPNADDTRVTIDATQGWEFSEKLCSVISCKPTTVEIDPGESKDIRVEAADFDGSGAALLRIHTEGSTKVVRVFYE